MTSDHPDLAPFDSAEYLASPEAIAEYITAAFEENDPALIAHAIGVAARAKGMSEIARATSLSRESLYRALSADGNPQLATLLKVIDTLGLRLSIAPQSLEVMKTNSQSKFEIHKDTALGWSWRLIEENGRVIAISSESFGSKNECLKAIQVLKETASYQIQGAA